MKPLFTASTNSGSEKELIQQNRSEVDSSNKKILGVLLRLTAAMFVCLCLLSLGVPGYTHLTRFYSCALFFLLLFAVLDWRILTARWSLIEFYIFLTFFFTYAVLSSAFFTPDALSIVFLLLILELQLLVTDRTIRINLFCAAFTLIYVGFMLAFKQPQFMYDEVVNALLMFVTGGLIGGYLRHAKLLNFELTRQANVRERIDFLTGLSSRRKLFEDMAASEAEGAPHIRGAMMLDVDLFKEYNDTYGHQSGDDCLQKLGACFLAFGQQHDLTFYRFGGEEFTALSFSLSSEELLDLGIRLNREVAALAMPHRATESGLVSVSIGVVADVQEDHYNPERLIGLADAALYHAKRSGRNRTIVYVPGMATDSPNLRHR